MKHLKKWSKNTKMTDNKKHLEIIYEALDVARERLKQMTENPIAVKTLAEIDKITTKVFDN